MEGQAIDIGGGVGGGGGLSRRRWMVQEVDGRG